MYSIDSIYKIIPVNHLSFKLRYKLGDEYIDAGAETKVKVVPKKYYILELFYSSKNNQVIDVFNTRIEAKRKQLILVSRLKELGISVTT